MGHAGGRIIDAIQQLPCDTEGGRHRPSRVTRMHALSQHAHRHGAVDQTAQRGRCPQFVIAARTRIQRDDEANIAHAW